MRIIAFTGPKTCGKDTAAAGLLNLRTDDDLLSCFRRENFAFGVKTICHDVFGWDFNDMDDPVFKETMRTEWPYCMPRQPMMDIANWMRDKYGPDVWVKTLEQRLKAYAHTKDYIAIVTTDLRFPNELDWLKRQDALIIYVERPEAEMSLTRAKAEGDPIALNPSESFYHEMRIGSNALVRNDGTIPQLHGQVLSLVQEKFGHWKYWGTEAERAAG